MPLSVHIHSLDCGHGRPLGIGVGEDHDGIFATELKTYAFESRRGFFSDGTAGGHRPDKADASHIRMAHKRGTDFTVAGDDVDNARREYPSAQFTQA